MPPKRYSRPPVPHRPLCRATRALLCALLFLAAAPCATATKAANSLFAFTPPHDGEAPAYVFVSKPGLPATAPQYPFLILDLETDCASPQSWGYVAWRRQGEGWSAAARQKFPVVQGRRRYYVNLSRHPRWRGAIGQFSVYVSPVTGEDRRVFSQNIQLESYTWSRAFWAWWLRVRYGGQESGWGTYAWAAIGLLVAFPFLSWLLWSRRTWVATRSRKCLQSRRIMELALRVLFLAVAGGLFVNIDAYVGRAVMVKTAFREAKGDYQLLRYSHPELATGFDARRYIPDEAVWYQSGDWLEQYILLQYGMYPNVHCGKEAKDTWDYLIDVTGSVKEPPAGWKQRRLSTGVLLYAAPGKDFLEPPRAPRAGAPAVAIGSFLLLTVLELLIGVAGLSALRLSPNRAGSLWFLGLAYLLGLVLLTGVAWGYLLLGMRLTRMAIVALAFSAMAVLALFGARPLARNLRELASLSALERNLPRSGAGIILVLGVLYFVYLVLLPTVLTPVLSYDALAHWIYKAQALAHHQSLAFSQDTFHAHNEYPLLWTLNAAMHFICQGAMMDEAVKWTVAVLILALLSQFLGYLAIIEVSPAWSWGLLPLYFFLFMEESLGWAYAEVLFVALVAAIVTALAVVFQDERVSAYLLLAFVLCAGLATAKLEGAPAVLIVAVAFALTQRRFPRSARGWLGLFLLGMPLLLSAGWLYYQREHGYLQVFLEKHGAAEALLWDKLALLGRVIFASVKDCGNRWYLAAGAGLVLALRTREPWGRGQVFLGIVGAGLLAFAALAPIHWPMDAIEQSTRMATPRLVLHASPALFLLLAGLLGRGHGPSPPDS